MDKIWLKRYPQGVPAEIGPLAESSLAELLANACRRHGGKTAYLSMGKGLSYAQLDRLSADFAGWLHSVGAGKGTRVALMMPNVCNTPYACSARCAPAASWSIAIRCTRRASSNTR